MPVWTPKKNWDGRDVFVIGGGTSLKTFDWDLLKSERTIGCNKAFELGIDICKICVFGDCKFYLRYKEELALFEGVCFTNIPRLHPSPDPWLWSIKRAVSGFHTDALGWNGNTGAAAINLSLLLGAKNTYLLGFDMALSDAGDSNWYDNELDKPNPQSYKKFKEGMSGLARDLAVKFPEQHVFNVTNQSALEIFPKLDLNAFIESRLSHGGQNN